MEANSLRVYSWKSFVHDSDDSVLTSRDFVFIKECIYSKPLHFVENGPETVRDFVGRPREKAWLYDIVSNVHSGVDVDKLDYLARDERRATRESGEVSHDNVEETIVAWADCPKPDKCQRSWCAEQGFRHLMVCYPEKKAGSTLEVFNKRFRLHKIVYQH